MQCISILILIIIEVLISIFFNLKSKLNYLSENILVLLVFNIIITIDLGINFLISIGNYSDGISKYGYLSPILITEERWTVDLFRQYYDISMGYTLVLFLVYLVTFTYYLMKKRKDLHQNQV